MNRTRTVFVVGAGSGVPYGMPAGNGLRSMILAIGAEIKLEAERTHYGGRFSSSLAACGTNWRPLLRLCDLLAATSPFSIDALLERHEDLMSLRWLSDDFVCDRFVPLQQALNRRPRAALAVGEPPLPCLPAT